MTLEPPADEFFGQDRLAVVTGASGALGRALSVAFTRAGVRVVGIARRADELQETLRQCEPGRFTSIVADVCDTARIREIFADIEAEIAPISILVNNAAVYPRIDILSEPAERILDQININLSGCINCAVAALHLMSVRGVGRIINVGSFAGDAPVAGSLGYSVSKAGVHALTAALAAETVERLPNILISEWIPGILDTPMGVPWGISPAVAAEWGVALALGTVPEMHGATFLQDRQHLAPRSLKRRLKDRVLRVSYKAIELS